MLAALRQELIEERAQRVDGVLDSSGVNVVFGRNKTTCAIICRFAASSDPEASCDNAGAKPDRLSGAEPAGGKKFALA